jgi:glycosyltransferase involved in cell wall biosynthesis
MYVIGSMGNGLAGTEHSLLAMIEYIDRESFEPYLVSLQDCEYIQRQRFLCDTACLHTYRMFAPTMWKQQRLLAARMRRLRIDVVQTFFVEGHLLGGRAARRAKVPAIISSRRNLGYRCGLKQRLLLKVANRYPHRFLANSNAVADAATRIEGLDRARFDIIYNGVDVTPLSGQSSSETVPNRDSSTVVMVANLRPVKSVTTLIEAAAIVVKTHSQARFVIIGDGPDRVALMELAKELGLETRITFAGKQSDVASMLNTATIGVLTSVSEGFSNAILEYLRAGLPVVATDVGGNREAITDGNNGYLIPVGNHRILAEKLNHLLSHPEQRMAMGRRGRERVEREFSLESMIRKHQDYYRHLVGR